MPGIRLALPLWLVLAATAAPVDRVVLFDDEISVPASNSRFLPVLLRKDLALLECSFYVVRGGSGVRVALLSRDAYERFRDGQGHEVLAATSYVRGGRLSAPVDLPGEYGVLIDNRLEGRGPAEVRVELALLFNRRHPSPVREVSPARRTVVVILSLLFLFVVAGYTAVRLRQGARAR